MKKKILAFVLVLVMGFLIKADAQCFDWPMCDCGYDATYDCHTETRVGVRWLGVIPLIYFYEETVCVFTGCEYIGG